MQKKNKIPDDTVIIGNKPIAVYYERVLNTLVNEDHIIIQCPKGKVSIANIMISTLRHVGMREDTKRKKIVVTGNKEGIEYEYDAIKITLHKIPELKE